MEQIARLPIVHSPLHRALRSWCIAALKSGNGRTSPGLARSTIGGHLAQLESIFAGWVDRDPIQAHAFELIELFVDHVENTAAHNLKRSIDAISVFMSFYNERRDDEEIDLDLDGYRNEQPVSADLIAPVAYASAVDALRRGKSEQAALILTLAFRTGARVDELTALQVGDFVEDGGVLEMVIQENRARALKTKTSRRIVPLDVLLNDDERVRITDWLHRRRGVHRVLGECWMFGEPAAGAPPLHGPIREQVEAALRTACGSDRVRFPHLRHSFASYLLATLLLPQDVPTQSVPSEFTPAVSPDRFNRVVDRLLGAKRLGGGAVHAVSQLMGHTGPAITLRSYCHLLDLCLGLYVERVSTLPPIPAGWLEKQLGITADARRKFISRLRASAAETDADVDVGTDPGRPSRAIIASVTPALERKMTDASLLKRGTHRLARGIAGAQAVKAEHAAKGSFYKRLNPTKPTRPSTRQPARADQPPPPAHVVPWTLIIAALDRADGARSGIDPDRMEEWRENARQLRALAILSRRHEAGICSYGELVPDDLDLRLYIDARLALARRLHRPEHEALLAALFSMRRKEGEIRLKRLADARAFKRLLRLMTFEDEEVHLSVTGRDGRHLPSEQIHRFLAGEDVARALAGRSGWRGSLVVRFRPKQEAGRVRAMRACRFALVMLAIDAGVRY